MKRFFRDLSFGFACLPWVCALLILPAGCIVPAGGGYGYGGDAVMGVNYYEPISGVYDFGDWGSDYRVGPPRAGGPRFGMGGAVMAGGYHGASGSRGMPSLPMAARGGGGGGRSSGGGRR